MRSIAVLPEQRARYPRQDQARSHIARGWHRLCLEVGRCSGVRMVLTSGRHKRKGAAIMVLAAVSSSLSLLGWIIIGGLAGAVAGKIMRGRSEEHTSELQSRRDLV